MKNLIITLAVALVLTFAVCFLDYRRNHPAPLKPNPEATPASKAPMSSKDVEAYIRKQVTKENVFKGLTPALIFSKQNNAQAEEFCCVGSASGDERNIIQILTAEHVFGIDKTGERSYRVEILNFPAQTMPLYFKSIFATGNRLSPNGDVVVLELGLEPVLFKQYSAYDLDEEVGEYGWGATNVGGVELLRVQSILSGAYMEVLGSMKSKKTGAMYIIIDYHSISGESGMAFIDDSQRTWVLHASPDAPEEQKMRADHWSKQGRVIRGVTLLSGPMSFSRRML